MADITLNVGSDARSKRLGIAAELVALKPRVVKDAEAIASTFADGTDKIVLYSGQVGEVLDNVRIHLTDLDTNGTPTLTWKLVTRDAAGTETDLVTGITTGQAAAQYLLAAPFAPLAIGGKKLVMVVTAAAATAVSGTITFCAQVFHTWSDEAGFDKTP